MSWSALKWRYICWRNRKELINRRVAIENVLFNFVAKGVSPDVQDCRVMALRLGVPKVKWSDSVRNHKWSYDNEA